MRRNRAEHYTEALAAIDAGHVNRLDALIAEGERALGILPPLQPRQPPAADAYRPVAGSPAGR